MQATFDEAEIGAAERILVKALESPDATAWVYAYTEDAILVAPSAPAVQGRSALLQVAKSMPPLSSVVIAALRTEGQGNLAHVSGQASWVNGRPPNLGSKSNVRFVIVWRREADGQWRVTEELLNTEPSAR